MRKFARSSQEAFRAALLFKDVFIVVPALSQNVIPPPPPSAIARVVCLAQAIHTFIASEMHLSLPHAQDEFMLLGVESGRISCSLDDQALSLCAGQALLILPECSISVDSITPSRFIYVLLRGTLTNNLLRETALQGLFFSHMAVLSEAVSQLLQAEQNGAPLDGAAASALAFSLLTAFYGKTDTEVPTSYPSIVVAALQILREEFAYLYGIDALADRLHVSKPHLIRSFTASVGISPGKYLTRIRIEYAKLMLLSGEGSLEAVAAASGFSGADYFCKVFRRETGMTPRRYAAQHTSASKVSIESLYV